MTRRFFSSDQLAGYRRDGFVVVPALFDAATMARMASWTEALQGSPEAPGKFMMYFENSLLEPHQRVLSRIENFVPYHSGFAEVVGGDALLGRTSELFGEPAVLFKDKINFKLPGISGKKLSSDLVLEVMRKMRILPDGISITS